MIFQDEMKLFLAGLLSLAFGGAALTIAVVSSVPPMLASIAMLLALVPPFVVVRWTMQNGWLRLLPQTQRRRVTLLLGVAMIVVGLVIGVLDHRAARDGAFDITEMQVRIHIEPGGEAVIEEELTVDFRRPRRGIIRELPPEIPETWAVDLPSVDVMDYYDEDGNPRSIFEVMPEQGAMRPAHVRDYEVLSVTLDGESVQVSESRRDRGLHLRIGDPHRWLEPGTYHYVLRYRAPSWTFVTGPTAEQAETRLNVPGFSWAASIDRVEVTVSLPGEVRAARCVQGPVGSTRSCDEALEVSGNELAAVLGPFPDHTGATLLLHSPAADFTEAPPRATVPDLDAGAWRTTLSRPLVSMLLAAVLVLLGVGLTLIDAWVTSGRSRRAAALTVPTALPAPPADLEPTEVAGLLHRPVAADLLLGELVRAEQRGLVGAEFQGRRVTITAPDDSRLRDHQVLAGLLPVTLGTFDVTTSKRINRACKQLALRARGAAEAHHVLRMSGRMVGLVRGVAALGVVAVGLWLTQVAISVSRLSAAAGFGVLVAFVFAMMFAAALWWGRRPPVTPSGAQLLAEVEAFDHFLATVEHEQLQWAAEQSEVDTVHPALRLLPYAIAVGRGDAWWSRFGGLLRTHAPDDWAVSLSQVHLLHRLYRASTHNPAAGSGGSGSFGGVGGGGGGGGGGSGGGGGGGRSW